MWPPQSSLDEVNELLNECLNTHRNPESSAFPYLPSVDDTKIDNFYAKPRPLCIGKFVSQSSDDDSPNKRLVTERALPIILGSGSGDKKWVQYAICQKAGCQNNFPEYLFFPTVEFRKKSDSFNLKALWKTNAKSKAVMRNEGLIKRKSDIQLNNADKLCLYKFGSGVVCFRVVVTTFHAGGMRHTIHNDWNIFWGKRIEKEEWMRASIYKKVNHFPGSKNIGRKDLLHWNILKAKKKYPIDYNFFPATFVLPHETLSFQKYRCHQSKENQTFIIKPVASSCGKGIYLTNSVVIPWRYKTSIVQQYVPNPLLIQGRKFDLRIYVALTSVQPLRLFIYDEGLVRIAPEDYPGDCEELTNIHKHVTNYSINKHCASSVDAEIKWNLARFKKWLFDNDLDAEKRWVDLQNSIESIVVKTFAAILPEIIRQGVIYMPHDALMQGCFELFGFDLLLDHNFKLYLLEVNIMPSLATESDIDIDVKCKLLSDLLILVGIAAYDRCLLGANDLPAMMPSLETLELLIATVLETNNFRLVFENEIGRVLLETIIRSKDELIRKGGFRRAFPTKDSFDRYSHLFDDRPDLTHFMMCWEQRYGEF